jgi:hypothetical protein
VEIVLNVEELRTLSARRLVVRDLLEKTAKKQHMSMKRQTTCITKAALADLVLRSGKHTMQDKEDNAEAEEYDDAANDFQQLEQGFIRDDSSREDFDLSGREDMLGFIEGGCEVIETAVTNAQHFINNSQCSIPTSTPRPKSQNVYHNDRSFYKEKGSERRMSQEQAQVHERQELQREQQQEQQKQRELAKVLMLSEQSWLASLCGMVQVDTIGMYETELILLNADIAKAQRVLLDKRRHMNVSA